VYLHGEANARSQCRNAITDAGFNALVQDLVKSLNKFNVLPREQQELRGILGPLKPDIVGV